MTLSASLQPGVSRRELWAWAMYDFANSGYTTVILTSVFSAYFVGVVAAGEDWATLAFTSALSLSYLAVMLTMPWLGARADAKASKRKLLFASTMCCVLFTLLLSLAGRGDVALAMVLLALSNYAYCVGESVVAAFLPELAQPHALGRVSGWGWGFGYFGGMLALGLSLVVVHWAQAQGLPAEQYVPWVVILTAVLFALAAIPSFLFMRERAQPSGGKSQGMLLRLGIAWRETRLHFVDFRTLLWCGLFYHAGISVVITLSAVYADQAMGFSMAQTMLLIFTVNIAAAVGALVFGHLQDRIGHKTALRITLLGWILMVLLAYAATAPGLFWVAATVAGLCMGTSQSAGRAMVGALAPSRRLAEFYGLWTFATQLAAVIGPFSYGWITWISDGNHKLALLCTGLFFVAGMLVLQKLDFSRGVQARLRTDASNPLGTHTT